MNIIYLHSSFEKILNLLGFENRVMLVIGNHFINACFLNAAG